MAQVVNNVIVFSEQGEKFWLVINGVKQNVDPQTTVKVSGLPAPNYKAKVIFENNNIPDLDQNIFFNDPGEYTYTVKKNKDGKYICRFVSVVPLAQAPPPPLGQTVIVYGQAPVVTTVTPVGGTVTQQTTTTTTTTDGFPNDNVNVNMGMNVGGVGVGINMNVNDGMGMGSSTTTSSSTYSTTTTTSGGGYVVQQTPPPTTVIYVPGYNGPVGCPMPMDPGAFSGARASIADADFESTKQDVARNVINNNCLTTDQIMELCNIFDFESTKLEMAKYAYTHCYDKGNYFKIGQIFDFDSSKSDLSNYTNSH